MDQKIKMNQPPLLTEEQRKGVLLLRKYTLSGNLRNEEWQFLKNYSPHPDTSLEEFISTMTTQLPAWRRHLRH